MIYTGNTSSTDYGQVEFKLPEGKSYADCWIISFEFLNTSLNQYCDWSCAYSGSGVFPKFSTNYAIIYTSGATLTQYRNVPFRLIIGYK